MPEREYNPNRKPITNRTFELTPQSLYYLQVESGFRMQKNLKRYVRH